MRELSEIQAQACETAWDGGLFFLPSPIDKAPLKIIASWAGGWDHVSVSRPNRPPNWKEMCAVKDAFFKDDEMVIQYHPAKKDYISIHPHCLHMWRPQQQEIPMPPKEFV